MNNEITRHEELNSEFTEEDLLNLLLVTKLSADKIFNYTSESGTLTIWKVEDEKLNIIRTYDSFLSNYTEDGLVFCEDIGVLKQFINRLSSGDKSEIYETMRIYDPEQKRYVWYKVRGTAITEGDRIKKVIGTLKNAEDEKAVEIKLMDKVERDPLTKVYNKEATTSLIMRHIETDSRENLSALIIIDIDNFKEINDNLGHLFGDSVLVDLSQDLHDLFRTSDVVGRIGGDEFLVYMRGIKSKKYAAEKAEEICAVFDSLYSGASESEITGSLGISIFPQDGITYEELFKKADMALYDSKNKGKNCFTFYDDCEHVESDEDFRMHVKRYHRDIPITKTNNVFINEITDYAFDIMDKTRDVSSAIIMLLSKVGKQFELSRVSVAETAGDPFCLKYTYQWCAKGIESKTGMLVTTTQAQWESKMQQYDDNDICSLVDIDKLCREIDSEELRFYQNMGVKSFIECAVYDSGDYRGYVSFNDCINNRIWSIEEVRTLKTISKIVSSYLLKMRAFERANKLVERLTNYDKLTGLPSLNIFTESVRDRLKSAGESENFALIYFDFNSFKILNEKVGFETADRILVSFAAAAKSICRGSKYTCRVFSDKFICLIQTTEGEDISDRTMKFIKRFTNKEKKSNDMDFNITICAGIYIVENPHDCDINIAIDNANIARKRAKLSQENKCELYTDEMKSEMVTGLEITGEVEQAIIDGEFIVYYQPKISLKSGIVVGAEALVRWRKPDGTMIYPNSFIPHLEKTMHIVSVDFYVYEEVCKYIRHCLDNDKRVVPISVNVSRMHLKTRDFIPRITELVEKYKIPTEHLEFELTESAFLDDENVAIRIMKDMRKLGFRVSIDDFGSGFSSLNLLKNLPVDILKLDKEFFGNGILKKNDAIVVSSIIDMASKMNIDVICEGVETEQQVDFLKGTECDTVQGYYYARPIPINEFEAYSNDVNNSGDFFGMS